MRSFLQLYGQDLQVVTELQGVVSKERMRKLRERIDRMVNQNVRQVALSIWAAKDQAMPR
jgi:hypothetical protein